MIKIFPSTIINFHAVYDTAWMDKVLRLLKRLYNPVSIHDIEAFYHQGKLLKNACHITFDDGDKSFYFNVFPLLKKHKFPASIYVSPKAAIERTNFWFQEIRGYDKARLLKIIKATEFGQPLETDQPLTAVLKSMKLQDIWSVISKYKEQNNAAPKDCLNMDTKQIEELYHSDLVAVGAHTLNHPILKNEDDSIVEKEIVQSVKELSSLLGEEVNWFAYPNGIPGMDFGQREISILRKTNVKLSFSTQNKPFNLRDSPLSIPRNGLTKGNISFILSKLVLGSKWNNLKSIVKGPEATSCREVNPKSDRS